MSETSKPKAPAKSTDKVVEPTPVVAIEVAPPPAKVPAPRHFSAVRKAREVLKEKAHELLLEHLNTIKMAAVAGKYEEALKAQQWLLDHIPAEDGKRIFDSGADKVQVLEAGDKGPLIQIGFQLGGVTLPKELPALTVEPILELTDPTQD